MGVNSKNSRNKNSKNFYTKKFSAPTKKNHRLANIHYYALKNIVPTTHIALSNSEMKNPRISFIIIWL